MQRLGYNRYAAAASGSYPMSRSSSGSGDSHLYDLQDEAAAAMAFATPVEMHDGQAAQTRYVGPGRYEITYDPDYVHPHPVHQGNYARASAMHEAMHVAVDRSYRTPDHPDYRFMNMNLPADGAGASVGPQLATIDSNLETLRNIALRDRGLSSMSRGHVLQRLDYAQAQPHVHYDTVLTDVVNYLSDEGERGTDTYREARVLSQEAFNRRHISNGPHDVQPYQQAAQMRSHPDRRPHWRTSHGHEDAPYSSIPSRNPYTPRGRGH
jgi:hypothetical protein